MRTITVAVNRLMLTENVAGQPTDAGIFKTTRSEVTHVSTQLSHRVLKKCRKISLRVSGIIRLFHFHTIAGLFSLVKIPRHTTQPIATCSCLYIQVKRHKVFPPTVFTRQCNTEQPTVMLKWHF